MTLLRPLPPADLSYVVERAEPIWRELKGERLFLTGGTGLFGVWLLESIQAANARLGIGLSTVVLSRDAQGFIRRAPHLADNPHLQWHAGDVRDFTPPGGSFSAVIHAAASTSGSVNAGRPLEAFDTIVLGTRRVLEFAEQAGARKLLFVSSGAVYGRQPPEMERMAETYIGSPEWLDPQAAYAEGKRAAELLCALHARQGNLEPKIARCFAFVGPHLPLDAHFAVGNFLRDALGGGDIVVAGDGTPMRSYLHMADLVVWLLTILAKGVALRAYNVGSDQAVSIAELAERVARVAGGRRVVIRRSPSASPPERYVPDIERARRELGLEPRIDLDDALGRTWRWLVA